MSDLISRQEAIDAAIEAADEWDGGYNGERERIIRGALEALPSAQPEQRWIPCSERLPEANGRYLVWMSFAPPERGIAVAEYCGGYWSIKTLISAWMPLPEPYRGI